MPKTNLPMPLGFYTSQSLPVSSQRCVNWIPTVMQGGSLVPSALLGRHGISQFTDTTKSICRGGHVMDGTAYFVNGTSLVSVASDGAISIKGTVSGSKRCVFADNGSIMAIVVPGGNSYTFDGTDFEQITDPDFQVSDTVSFYRGFFVFTTTDGKQLFVSNLNQPNNFDALDFGSAEGDPDRIVTQILDHDELSIIGERTKEVFRLVGGAGFPLQIIPGAFTEKGAHSKYGAIKFDSSFLYLGGGVNEGTAVWRQTSSAQAGKISTDAIDCEIQKFTKEEIAEAFAMNFSDKGQSFALFTFNSSRIPSRTFVYNGTASSLSESHVWFELQSGVTDAKWRVNAILKAYGKLLTGDSLGGKIGYLNASVKTEFDYPIFYQAAFQPFGRDGTTLFSGEFEATFEAGVGLTSGQGSNPVVRMDFSDDGGRTWSSEFSRSIGKIGAYEQRAVWRRQGRIPFARTVRFTLTDPVTANFIKLTANLEIGAQ